MFRCFHCCFEQMLPRKLCINSLHQHSNICSNVKINVKTKTLHWSTECFVCSKVDNKYFILITLPKNYSFNYQMWTIFRFISHILIPYKWSFNHLFPPFHYCADKVSSFFTKLYASLLLVWYPGVLYLRSSVFVLSKPSLTLLFTAEGKSIRTFEVLWL